MNYNEMVEHIKNCPSPYEAVVINETDPLGMLIHLTPAGKLVDCWAKPISKKATFCGRIVYKNGKPQRISWQN